MVKNKFRSIFILLLIYTPLYVYSETIKYAVFPAPPYMIGADKEDSILSGIDVEIVNEVAKPFLNELPIAFYYRKDSGIEITQS